MDLMMILMKHLLTKKVQKNRICRISQAYPALFLNFLSENSLHPAEISTVNY